MNIQEDIFIASLIVAFCFGYIISYLVSENEFMNKPFKKKALGEKK